MVSVSSSRHADRIHEAIGSHAAATSALIASWRRSARLHHLDPAADAPPCRLTDAELAAARQRIALLIAAAQASLDRLYHAVGGNGCCVLLADSNGVPVERRGSASDDDTFRAWGLWPGSIWNEGTEGTNGIGTCLVEGQALTVHRDQHFFTRNTPLSCTAAPIYDHEGHLAAALDVSSCRADLTESWMNLIAGAVRDAARRIEAENFRLSYPNARIVLAPNGAANALLAVDREDLVIGATRSARQTLGITRDAIGKALPAVDVFGSDVTHGEELKQAERAVLERALIRMDGNVSAAARALGISRATLHRKLKKLGVRAGQSGGDR